MMDRIAIIGGGRVGRAACSQFRQRWPKAQLSLLDIRAGELGERHPDIFDGIRLINVDLSDDRKLRQSLTADAVVNTAGPFYRHGGSVLRAAIDARIDYVDVCDESKPLEEMRALSPEARKSGIRAIIGCGFSPGFTNVVCGQLRHREWSLEEVNVAWCMSMADPVGRAAALHALHIVRPPARHLHDGQLVPVKPLMASRTISFPPPFGSKQVYDVEHSEPVTLVTAFPELRNSWVGGAIIPEKAVARLRAYAELELTKSEPILVSGSAVDRSELVGALDREYWATYDFSESLPRMGVVLVHVVGTKQGRPVERQYAMAGSTAEATAAGALAGVTTLSGCRELAPGVHFSEEAVAWPQYGEAAFAANCRLFALDDHGWSRIDGDEWLA